MDWLTPIVQRVTEVGQWAPLLFIALYVVAALLLAPAFVLTFSAGAIFGLWLGTLYVYIGAVLGSSAVFVVAAPLARSRLLGWVDRDPRIAAARRAVVDRSAWIMFLLRLSPLVPYSFLNYALALSGVRYRDFLLASVGMIPSIVMYVYYGKVAGDVAVLAARVVPPRGLEYYTLLLVGLVVTVAATTLITRAARKAFEEAKQVRGA